MPLPRMVVVERFSWELAAEVEKGEVLHAAADTTHNTELAVCESLTGVEQDASGEAHSGGPVALNETPLQRCLGKSADILYIKAPLCCFRPRCSVQIGLNSWQCGGAMSRAGCTPADIVSINVSRSCLQTAMLCAE